MSLRLTEEQLAALEKKRAEWKAGGNVRTHRIEKKMPGVDIDAVHQKYRNRQTEVDGILFDSQREAQRYRDLRLLEAAKEIQDLKRQVKFDLKVKGMLICRYIADFTYQEKGNLIVEDAKGFPTREFRLKEKLMLAIHNIVIKRT